MQRAGESRKAQPFAANRAIGRIGLAVHASDGVSRRSRVREEGSLRVRFPGQPAPQIEAVVINTAGGVAGGDVFSIDVTVDPDASLLVTTASAEKVYRSLGDDAAITVTLRAAAGASLTWLPRETILFDRSRLARTIDVELAEDARFMMAEAVMFGRASMGEAVESGRFTDRWRVRRGGRLAYAETIRLDGDIAARLAKTAVAAGGIAIATILISPPDERFAAAITASAAHMRGEVGVSTWNGLTAARFCASDGESLRHDMIAALGIALDGPPPKLWLN